MVNNVNGINMKPHFRPANADDVYKLYPRIRKVDQEEVHATITYDYSSTANGAIYTLSDNSSLELIYAELS